jgi:hypothetical protein
MLSVRSSQQMLKEVQRREALHFNQLWHKITLIIAAYSEV